MRLLSYCFVIFCSVSCRPCYIFPSDEVAPAKLQPTKKGTRATLLPAKKAPAAVPRSATDRGGELAPEGAPDSARREK